MAPHQGHQPRLRWLEILSIRPRFVLPSLITAFLLLSIAFVLRDQVLQTLASLTTGRPSTSPPHHHPERPPLHFTASPGENTFKISIFEDLHFGEAEDTTWGPEQDERTLVVMSSILDIEKPDLVVLNGDLITGEDTLLQNATLHLDKLVTPMVERNIPWASAYGNHDQEFNVNGEGILERENAYRGLTYTQRMVSGDPERVGVSNYFLPLYHHHHRQTTDEAQARDDLESVAAFLWFFDSRGGKAFQRVGEDGEKVQVPGVVDPAVTEWFTRTSQKMNGNQTQRNGQKTPMPSLAFVHIPISAMRTFQASPAGVDAHREPGINDDIPLDSQTGDSDFLDALLNEGVLAVFSGHDHGNDWCMPYRDAASERTGGSLFACFGRHTGYGGYGHWMRGSRQVLLREDGELETWVRLEDGDVSGHVVLNTTFGADVYPEVKKAFTSLGVNGTS